MQREEQVEKERDKKNMKTRNPGIVFHSCIAQDRANFARHEITSELLCIVLLKMLIILHENAGKIKRTANLNFIGSKLPCRQHGISFHGNQLHYPVKGDWCTINIMHAAQRELEIYWNNL